MKIPPYDDEDLMLSDWGYDDCRLENNGIIPPSYGYNKKFKYDIEIPHPEQLGRCIDWCIDNCKHKWGWYHESLPLPRVSLEANGIESRSFLSFSRKKEAFMFSVSCL
tara:strand:+ start:36 stop:359 length:324 start_codon:yes stop_codon:yes gene_type:complete